VETSSSPRRLILAAMLAAIAPAVSSAQSYNTPSARQQDRVAFVVCPATACTTGTNLTNHFIVSAAGTIRKCYAQAKTAPIGAALIFDIRRNGTSIFGASPKLQVSAGSTATNTASAFGSPTVAEGDLLRIDITQTGTTAAGQDVAVVCMIQR